MALVGFPLKDRAIATSTGDLLETTVQKTTSLHQTATAPSSSWETIGAITNQPAGQILTSTSAVNRYAELLSSLEQASLLSAEQSAFVLVTQNGGVCLMSPATASASPPAGTPLTTGTPLQTNYYAAKTARNDPEARDLRTFQTSISHVYVTSTSSSTNYVVGSEIPISDIPICEPVQAAATPTYASNPAATALSDGSSLESMGSDGGGDGGLDAGQRAGLALGIVAAVVAALVAGVWWFRRRAMRRRSTNAQRNLWGWAAGDDDNGAGAHGFVGARNAEVGEARHMVSGVGLREVLYGRPGARGYR